MKKAKNYILLGGFYLFMLVVLFGTEYLRTHYPSRSQYAYQLKEDVKVLELEYKKKMYSEELNKVK